MANILNNFAGFDTYNFSTLFWSLYLTGLVESV